MAIIKNLFLPAVPMHSKAENWRENGKIYSAAINNKLKSGEGFDGWP